MDLNADIGEATDPAGRQAEQDILTCVTSANIACGGHAGDKKTMRSTLRAATANGVVIGAHPSYPDPEHFGRRSLIVGQDIRAEDLRDSLTDQIQTLIRLAEEEGAQVRYVKPHGALYNDAVADPEKATLIAEVIAGVDPGLAWLGGPQSEMGRAAEKAGLHFIPEGFIDRRYTDDGHLLSRQYEGAVLQDQTERMNQAVSLAVQGTVKTRTGQTLTVHTRSLCLHGDSAGAVETARMARATLEEAGVMIKAFLS